MRKEAVRISIISHESSSQVYFLFFSCLLRFIFQKRKRSALDILDLVFWGDLLAMLNYDFSTVILISDLILWRGEASDNVFASFFFSLPSFRIPWLFVLLNVLVCLSSLFLSLSSLPHHWVHVFYHKRGKHWRGLPNMIIF